jgi:hypothetical protein
MAIPPAPISSSMVNPDGSVSAIWSRYFLETAQTVSLEVAPANAAYLTTTANPSLTNESSLGSLASGYLKIAVAGSVASPSTTATIPTSDLTGPLPALDGSALTDLNASELTSGTIPDARLPDPLPARSGANLTDLNADELASGTIPDARFPATLPALIGSALTALTGTNVTHQVSQIDAGDSPYTVLASDEFILADATSGAITVTLPSSVSGRWLMVKKLDSSANLVTLDAGAASIDGASTALLSVQWHAKTVIGDGSDWFVVAEVV